MRIHKFFGPVVFFCRSLACEQVHLFNKKSDSDRGKFKVSLLGVDSLWGDCMFIPADWGS